MVLPSCTCSRSIGMHYFNCHRLLDQLEASADDKNITMDELREMYGSYLTDTEYKKIYDGIMNSSISRHELLDLLGIENVCCRREVLTAYLDNYFNRNGIDINKVSKNNKISIRE